MSAFISVLQPSEELLGAVDVLRQQIADAVRALKSVSAEVNARPLVRWWCPCCHHYHDGAECNALARVSPCEHCGSGHSKRSCPIRRAQVQQARASVQPVEARPPGVPHPSATGIVFGDMVFPVSAPQGKPELAQVERTASLRTADPSTRTAAPQLPAADPVAQTPVVTLARGGDIPSPDVDPESPATAFTDSNSSSEEAQGERTGVGQAMGVTTATASSAADPPIVSHVTPVVTAGCATQTDETRKPATTVSGDVLCAAISVTKPDESTTVIPRTSVRTSMHRELVSPTVPQRRRLRDVDAPAAPVELYPFTRNSHPGQCCYRQCGGALYGSNANMHKEYFVATVNRGSMHPLRGLCLCQQCHEDSELFQALFPYPMPVIELPVVDPKRPNDLNSVYQTNQRNPGCCGKTGCGKQLQDHYWIAPRECDLLKNVYLCSECRSESDNSKFLFPTRLTLSNGYVSDRRKYFLFDGDFSEFILPSSWTICDYPSTLKEQHAKIFAQFVHNYGHELLCASLRDQPIPTVPQVMAQLLTIFRAKNSGLPTFLDTNTCPYKRPYDATADYSAHVSKYLGEHPSLTAALPLLLSAGFNPVSEGCLPALSKHKSSCMEHQQVIDHLGCNRCDIPAYKVIDKFCCDHCNVSLSVQSVTEFALNDVLRTTLIKKHLLHSPRCQSLDKLKRECILPEFFFPDNRGGENKRKLQAALRDRVNRRTKFVKSLQDASEFTVMPPPGDPNVYIFNRWTNTNFDEVYWNSIVPSCSYVLA